jgi:hypothetical protein
VEKRASGRERLLTTRSLTLRYVFRWEMEHLFARAGFDAVDLFGNFDRDPFETGLEQVWVARRKDDA